MGWRSAGEPGGSLAIEGLPEDLGRSMLAEKRVYHQM
jgi:hypothetical protein